MKIATFICNDLEENTYVLSDESKECVIVDAGCVEQEEKEKIKHYIEENHLRPIYQLNTHLHLDHCVGANFITEQYGLKVRANPLDYPVIGKMKHLLGYFGLKEEDFKIELGEPLEEGNVISFGTTRLMLLHVPGHSPGSMVLYNAMEHLLLSGDVLFRRSVGRGDLFGGNSTQLIESIKQKLFPLPEDTKVYPGHGFPTTLGEEKRENPFLQ